MSSTLPKLHASVALIDMDGTIVPSTAYGDYFAHILCELVAQRHHVDLERAEHMIRRIVNLGEEPIEQADLDVLKINFDDYWQAIMRWQEEHMSVYSDAVRMIRGLQEMGVLMYPATTNAGLVYRGKLARAGLAGPTGPTCFAELWGGSEVHPAGKSSPAFYTALIQKIGRNPSDMVMIGDDLVSDLRYAQDAGIDKIIIIQRDQTEMWRQADGAIFVNTLDIVLDMWRISS